MTGAGAVATKNMNAENALNANPAPTPSPTGAPEPDALADALERIAWDCEEYGEPWSNEADTLREAAAALRAPSTGKPCEECGGTGAVVNVETGRAWPCPRRCDVRARSTGIAGRQDKRLAKKLENLALWIEDVATWDDDPHWEKAQECRAIAAALRTTEAGHANTPSKPANTPSGPTEAGQSRGDAVGGVGLIAAERRRQVEAEGWTPEHDDGHTEGEMALAGAAYALYDVEPEIAKRAWPYGWWGEWWKPKDRIRNLVRAGALIAAEIDRLQRKGDTDGQ